MVPTAVIAASIDPQKAAKNLGTRFEAYLNTFPLKLDKQRTHKMHRAVAGQWTVKERLRGETIHFILESQA